MSDVWLRGVPSDADPDDVRLYPKPDAASGPAIIIGARFALAEVRRREYPEEEDAVRTNHSLRLLFGRTPAAAGTVGAPWYLWPTAARTDQAGEDEQRSVPETLHRYRSASTVVRQPFFMWSRTSQPMEADADQQSTDHTRLHRHRTGYQTVGQGYRLWPPAAKADQATEPDAQRADQTLLHRYRVGYQTVGQPFSLWRRSQVRLDDVEFDTTPRQAGLDAFRRTIATGTGQPWWLWPRADRLDHEVDQNPIITAHAAALYPFRQITAATLDWPTEWTWTDRPAWQWSESRNLWIVTSGGGPGALALEWPAVSTWTGRPKWRWSVSANKWIVTS